MTTQDKEFDDAVRSKLDDLTMEPSAAVWKEIDRRIDKTDRRRSLMPFISVAASIVVLMTAGILFIPQKRAVNGGHPVKKLVAKVIPAVNVPQRIKKDSEPIAAKQNGAGKYVNTGSAAASIAGFHPVKETKLSPAKTVNTMVDTAATIKTPEQPLLAAMPGIKEAVSSVIPDDAVQSKTTDAFDQSAAFTAKPTLTATQLPADNKAGIATAKRKHVIRNFGDLVNVVVAKVDKRKDKIIEFTNTDDDEANITGVNLGILKIKRDTK